MAELDAVAALDSVEEVGVFERGKRVARRHDAVDDEARDDAVEARRVVVGEAEAVEKRSDDGGEGLTGETAADPVAKAPVVAVAPDGGVEREGGKGPRIPGINVDMAKIEHAAAVDGRDGVGAVDIAGVGRIEGFVERLQIAALHEVVARTQGIIGQERFRAFRIDEDVGLVGALVDGRAAEFHEPDGFGLRDPGGGCGGLGAAGAVVMRR